MNQKPSPNEKPSLPKLPHPNSHMGERLETYLASFVDAMEETVEWIDSKTNAIQDIGKRLDALEQMREATIKMAVEVFEVKMYLGLLGTDETEPTMSDVITDHWQEPDVLEPVSNEERVYAVFFQQYEHYEDKGGSMHGFFPIEGTKGVAIVNAENPDHAKEAFMSFVQTDYPHLIPQGRTAILSGREFFMNSLEVEPIRSDKPTMLYGVKS